MNIFVIFALAVGLSMDAFAVSICKGLTLYKVTLKKAIIVGLYFGVFQAGMPLIGYAVANRFADMIMTFSHWIAFGLLCFLGIKMIIGSLKKDNDGDKIEEINNNDKTYIIETGCISEKVGKTNCINDEPGNLTDIVSDDDMTSVGPKVMLPLALATSIDALAVGVTIAFLQTNIWPLTISAGFVTFLFSALGVKIGSIFGVRFKSKAELIGVIILILIGINILL